MRLALLELRICHVFEDKAKARVAKPAEMQLFLGSENGWFLFGLAVEVLCSRKNVTMDAATSARGKQKVTNIMSMDLFGVQNLEPQNGVRYKKDCIRDLRFGVQISNPKTGSDVGCYFRWFQRTGSCAGVQACCLKHSRNIFFDVGSSCWAST